MGRQEGAPSSVRGPPGWKGSRQAAFLTVAILTSPTLMAPQNQHSSITRILVTAQPSNPIQEGGNVTLIPGMSSTHFSRCIWYRERAGNAKEMIIAHEKGPFALFLTGDAFTGRVTMVAGCSIYIESLAQADTGMYTIDLDEAGEFLATGHVKIEVVGHASSDWSAPPRQNEDIVTIVVGAFCAVIVVGIGIVLFFWICFRRLKNRRPTGVVITPSAPPPRPPTPPPSYENIFPLGQVSPTSPPANTGEIGGIMHPSLPKDN
nr:uncharacterized protein LOC110089447 isoform X1 [Pogona vitticeps]